MVKPGCSNFRVITANFSDVRIFTESQKKTCLYHMQTTKAQIIGVWALWMIEGKEYVNYN